jgi:hypothetical protein
MLLASLYLRLDPMRFQMRLEPAPDPVDQIAATLVQLFQPLGDGLVSIRLELAKGERLHLVMNSYMPIRSASGA